MRNFDRGFLLLCLLGFIVCFPVFALDFFLRPKVFMFVPMGTGNLSVDGIPRYDTGAGADVGFDFDLSSVLPNPLGIGYTVGIEGGMTSNSLLADPRSLLTYSAGGGIGLYYFPLSRLFTRLDATVGVYKPALEKEIGPVGLYWRMGGEIGFRFTPSFILAANAAWREYRDDEGGTGAFISGMGVGLTAQLTLAIGGGTGRAGAEAVMEQYGPVYPAFLQLYQTSSIGRVIVRNRENAEIRNVRLSFRAPPYTTSEYACGRVSFISRGRAAEMPLLADFSSAILRFTDSGRILGELVIRYTFLGQEREAVSAVTIEVHNRNHVTEGDTAALAAFISPTSTETLEYSKYVIGLARTARRTGHSQNMQFAIWLFEGMRASGIRMGETYGAESEAQFPAETLVFGSGTSRDLALLYAAALESVGISSALVKVGTDYLVAIDLSMGEAAAGTMFNDLAWVLNLNGEMWLPVALSSFNDGFMASWTRGAVTLNQAFEREEFVDFILAKDAWAAYPPAPLPELGTRIARSDSADIIEGANRALDAYVNQDILPILWKTEAEISRAPTPALYNRQGILLTRAGRINEAKTSYERAARQGSIPAMTNLGNLALTERDYARAEYWFQEVLAQDSGNITALQGMERVEGRRD